MTEIGSVERESAEYCAGYVVKKITGEAAEIAYARVNPETGESWQVAPEYGRMSLKPGIGLDYCKKFASDMLAHGGIVYPGGTKVPIPRYFANQLRELHSDRYEAMAYKREVEARANPENFAYERRQAEIQIQKAKNKLKRRSL